MQQELLARIEGLEANIKELSTRLNERIIRDKKVYYEKSSIANDFGLSEPTVRRHIANGILDGYKFGKKIYVKREQLLQKIEEGKIMVGMARA